MWGNRLGWMISAGIVVVTIGIYAMLILGSGMTPPTKLTTEAGAMDPIVIPGSPRSIVPAGNGGDGTQMYLDAIEAYNANPDQYAATKLAKLDISPAGLKKLKAIELVVQASDASKATVFATQPSRLVRYGLEQHKALIPLENLGKLTNNIGVRLRIAKRTAEAKKFHEACFNLGYTMCNERLTYMEFYRGQELMQVASIELSTTDPSRVNELKEFPTQMRDLLTSKDSKFTQIRDAIRTVDQNVIKRNAGDVFNLAKNSQERMWKVEAIMAVGNFRYNAGSPGDQRGANKFLEQLAADDSLDAPAKAAVKAAQELTLAQHNTSAQMP